MLTVKYLYANGDEAISEYETVTTEVVEGLLVVHAIKAPTHPGRDGAVTTFGPVYPQANVDPKPESVVYVMNSKGSTVGKYVL